MFVKPSFNTAYSIISFWYSGFSLENNFYTQILDEATKDYSQADIDKLKPAFRQYANQLAQGGLDEYEAMLENAYNIPSFGENAEDFEAWYEQNSETLRNLVEWSGQKVKKIFKILVLELLNLLVH